MRSGRARGAGWSRSPPGARSRPRRSQGLNGGFFSGPYLRFRGLPPGRDLTPPKSEKSDAATTPPAATPAPASAGGTEPKEGGKKGKEGKGKEGGEKKGGKGATGGKSGPPEGKIKKVSDNPNFRYIVRVANTDLDGTRATVMALTKIPGVGMRVAEATTRLMGLNAAGLIGDLTEEQTDAIEGTLTTLSTKLPPWMLNHPNDRATGETRHTVATEWETSVRDDVNLMKMIRCYKGIRHERGQKVRGQRTKNNGRTGMAAGVLKKLAKEAAAGAKKGAEGDKEKKK